MNQTAINNILVFMEYAFYLGCGSLGLFLVIEMLEKVDGFKEYLTQDIE